MQQSMPLPNFLSTSVLGKLEDQQHLDAECTELHYNLFSNIHSVVLTLFVDGSCSSLDGSTNRLTFPVELIVCLTAFKLSQSTGGCVCEDRLQKYTNSCDINDQTILCDGDFWVGYDNQSKSQGLILQEPWE